MAKALVILIDFLKPSMFRLNAYSSDSDLLDEVDILARMNSGGRSGMQSV